jgi:hypothetical protein
VHENPVGAAQQPPLHGGQTSPRRPGRDPDAVQIGKAAIDARRVDHLMHRGHGSATPAAQRLEPVGQPRR